jgi:mannose-6-phosphate isomerase-like protein (cupin superfamily)
MVPTETRVKARSLKEFGPLDRHPGEEYIYVVEGAIEVYIEPEGPVRLRAGDSCYFDARTGHAAISVGSGDAVVLSITSSPAFSGEGVAEAGQHRPPRTRQALPRAGKRARRKAR